MQKDLFGTIFNYNGQIQLKCRNWIAKWIKDFKRFWYYSTAAIDIKWEKNDGK